MDGCLLRNKIPFIVGGVKGRFLAGSYNDAEVTTADFTFDSRPFEHLRTGLVDKYSQARCLESEVITRIGMPSQSF